jgi:peptidyl-prolyl cis-trans isomerase D
MAVIQKIRDKYAKLAGGVIVVALLGFIFTDFAKGGGKAKTTIGKINGDKISVTEYQAAVDQREAQAKQQNPQGHLNDDARAQLRDEAWNQLVNEKLLENVEDKLGITVTKAEIKDLFTGSNPDPSVKQAFTNQQTGVFNPQEVAATIEQLRKDKDPQRKASWESFEAGIIKNRHANKFNALVNGAIYTPKFILDDINNSRNEIAKINYVKLPYTLVADADVKVTDDDIKKYLNDHKTMFTIKETTRSIDFVTFNIVPSAADSARAFADLEKLKAEFATTTDVESFVNRNSQSQIPVAYYTKDQLKSLPNVEELMGAGAGSIVGPFYDGQNFTLAKIEDKKTLPDSIKVRHILISVQPSEGKVALSEAQAKARIDSVVAMVNGGVPFDTLAVHYSDDAGSKDKGGEYEFTLANRAGLVKEFGDFVFEGHTGEKKVVKSSFGYHYIEILNQKAPTTSSKIAFVARPFSYSEGTNSALYTSASQFASQAKNAATFDQIAKAKGYQIGSADGLNKNSFVLNNLGSSRDLVRWAYDAKVGDISTVYTIGDKYVVAKLSGAMDAGLAPINAKTRPFLEPYVKKIKKAEILKNKTKDQKSLEAIAQSQGQQVGTADSVNFAQGFVPGLGQEAKVVGYSFNKAFKPNTMSPAIAGQDGVYFINLLGRSALPAQPRNIEMEQKMSDYQMKANAAQLVMAGLKEASEVKDNRADLN